MYTLAKERIPRVAQAIADFINFMIRNNYTTHYDVILVGHHAKKLPKRLLVAKSGRFLV